MDTIITKQYSLRSQPFYNLVGTTIGLVDGNNQNLSFYTQKLKQANLNVIGYSSLPELSTQVVVVPVDIVVFSPSLETFPAELRLLKNFIAQNPELPLITMAKTMQEMEIDAIMKSGARLHINRDLSQPRDLLVALEQIIISK